MSLSPTQISERKTGGWGRGDREKERKSKKECI